LRQVLLLVLPLVLLRVLHQAWANCFQKRAVLREEGSLGHSARCSTTKTMNQTQLLQYVWQLSAEHPSSLYLDWAPDPMAHPSSLYQDSGQAWAVLANV